MSQYLDKLQSTLTETQTKQITDLLVKKKNSGEILNLDEFKNELAKLTNKLLADKITPSLELFIDKLGQIIDSKSYNSMLEHIRNDLETVFIESDNLFDISDRHNNLVNQIILKALKQGIAELDSKISIYEFLNSSIDGFSNAQFNTFKSNSNAVSRIELNTNFFFIDPRTSETISSDALISLIGEHILLGADSIDYINIKNIQLVFDSGYTQSEELVDSPINNINNVIDNKRGTSWQYSILQREVQPSGITIKLQLDLSSNKDINFIEIEPAIVFPIELTSLQYIDNNQELQTIYLNTVIDSTKRIYFDNINSKKLFVSFIQRNPIETQFLTKPELFSATSMNTPVTVDTQLISADLKKVITSFQVQNIIGANTPFQGKAKRYYNYSIGFDNIRVGYSLYNEASIFVGETIKVDNLTQTAIKVKEQRPSELSGIIKMTTDTYPIEYSDNFFHGSLEYWLVAQDYGENDQLLAMNTVPILPYGVSRIFHERLLLTHLIGDVSLPNAGVLMFFTRFFNYEDKIKTKVYRNGTLLTYGTDWDFETTTLTNNIEPPNGHRNVVGIKITSPSLTDFYTVSYDPFTSNTRVAPGNISNLNLSEESSLLQVIDLVGDASIIHGKDNILYFSPSLNNQNIKYTKLNLVIILRRNSVNLTLSPILDEYLLLVNNKNTNRFAGISNVK